MPLPPYYSVSSKPSPIGLPQCAAILSYSKRRNNISGKLSLNATTPNGPWTKWRKDLTGLPDRSMMGGNNSAQPANHGVQSKGHIVIPYTQGLCESIKKICGRYGIQTHFKGGKTIKTFWSPLRTRTLCSTKVVPYTGTNATT